MAVKGFLLCAHGALFVLLPGFLMFAILGRMPRADRSLLWWGAGALLIVTIPQRFFESLAAHLLYADSTPALASVAAAALLAAAFMVLAVYMVIKFRRVSGDALIPGGTAIGLGMGWVNQLFQGFVILGVGIRMLQGDATGDLVVQESALSVGQLGVNALGSLLGRVAWLLVSAALGALIGKALHDRRRRLLWLAVALHAGILVVNGFLVVGLAGKLWLATAAALAFEVVLVVAAWWWLRSAAEEAARGS